MLADIDKNILKEKINIDNPIIFDVGTFDGNDSLEFLNLFDNPTIYAFEADDRSINLFNKHVGDASIQLIKTALADVDGHITFYQSDSNTRKHKRHNFEKTWSASSSIKKPNNHTNIFPDIQFGKSVKVKSAKLDTWITDKNIPKIDIMWVDVNGGEEEFLSGAIHTITNKVKYLYIEFNAVDDRQLYNDCLTKDDIKKKLPNFKELGVYNFMGNFGNVLLENENL